ncbi:hypothetical protein FB45DRAFT_1056431 [Roridomyces roridus]|uniref:Uncharacterized protein n=1 Tax=Roridomyces roridus TaxID=1738132 RepID=A0AAD7FNB6_9AGAR|nr:hypothetical protein FB45DRAFT_1056431 [Roridomyces roridus]
MHLTKQVMSFARHVCGGRRRQPSTPNQAAKEQSAPDAAQRIPSVMRPLFFQERSGKVDDSAAPGRSLLTPAATDVDVRSDTASESPSASFSSSLPPTTTNPESSTSTALAALHLACATWRRRAETHAAGNARLLLFARKARDCVIRMRTERDEARNECVLLRRLMGEILEGGERGAEPVESGEGGGLLLSPSPFAPVRDRSTSAASVRAELPMFLQQSQEASGDVHGENEVLGSPMKRRRVGHESEKEKEKEEKDVVG